MSIVKRNVLASRAARNASRFMTADNTLSVQASTLLTAAEIASFERIVGRPSEVPAPVISFDASRVRELVAQRTTPRVAARYC